MVFVRSILSTHSIDDSQKYAPLLTLCRQFTLYTQGFDLILHSKYTSAPSCIDDVFEFVPSSSVTTGLSECVQCLLSDFGT